MPEPSRDVRVRLAPFLQRPLDLTLGVAVRDHAALVGSFATLCERELDLHATFLEVHPDGDERQAFLANLPVQGIDLLAVEQKLAVSVRIMPR